MKTKEEWIKDLALEPHVEGGYFKQTYKSELVVSIPNGTRRTLSTSILFLLSPDSPSHFHQLSSDEIWYYHFGNPLTVHMIYPDGRYEAVKIGPEKGQHLQFTVPAGVIFGSSVENNQKDSFSIVSCSVSPGFEYEDFQLFTREELLNRFPNHQEIIYQLTRI